MVWFEKLKGGDGHRLFPVSVQSFCCCRRHSHSHSHSHLGSQFHFTSRGRSTILIHTWYLSASKKRLHLWLQALAIATGIFGIWTNFQGNFYTLHSWMVFCVYLFLELMYHFY
ncbi:hypothetical protein R6Q57_024662 [Mikania cordata]